ncbi:hypothetical protein E2320_000148, partial [Naja naja]
AQGQLLPLLAHLLSVPSVPASAPLLARSAATGCSPVPTSFPQWLLTTPQERPGIHVSWGEGGRAGMAGWMLPGARFWKRRSGRESHGHLTRLPLSVEKGCDLIPFTLQKPLPPRLSVPLLRLQEEPHSCGDWLALQPRGKVRGKCWGDGRSVPFPSQPNCLRLLLFPFVGEEPNVFSLARQSWLRKRHHQGL